MKTEVLLVKLVKNPSGNSSIQSTTYAGLFSERHGQSERWLTRQIERLTDKQENKKRHVRTERN